MSKMTKPRTNNDLYLYMASIRKFPMLTPESEFHLAQAMITKKDDRARDQLINSHLRFVAKIARAHHKRYGLSLEELIATGNIGLIEAVRRFDLEQGVRLVTYARWKINQEIKEYVLHNWSLVKIGTSHDQKKLFFNLARLKSQLGIVEEGDLQPQDVTKIADKLQVSRENVVTMNRRIRGDCSLNTPVWEDEEKEWQDTLVSEDLDPEKIYASRSESAKNKAALAAALSLLSEKERDIFVRRRLYENPESYSQIKLDYGVSRHRIEQIDKAAFKKVQRAVCAYLAGEKVQAPRARRKIKSNTQIASKVLEVL